MCCRNAARNARNLRGNRYVKHERGLDARVRLGSPFSFLAAVQIQPTKDGATITCLVRKCLDGALRIRHLLRPQEVGELTSIFAGNFSPLII